MPLIRVQEINGFNANTIIAPLTGWTSGAGTVSASDTIISALQKHDGNISLLAPLASPTFTGTPSAPTATTGTNTTQLATTAFVNNTVVVLLANNNTWTGSTNTFSPSVANYYSGTTISISGQWYMGLLNAAPTGVQSGIATSANGGTGASGIYPFTVNLNMVYYSRSNTAYDHVWMGYNSTAAASIPQMYLKGSTNSLNVGFTDGADHGGTNGLGVAGNGVFGGSLSASSTTVQQLSLNYNSSYYMQFTVGSTGTLQIANNLVANQQVTVGNSTANISTVAITSTATSQTTTLSLQSVAGGFNAKVYSNNSLDLGSGGVTRLQISSAGNWVLSGTAMTANQFVGSNGTAVVAFGSTGTGSVVLNTSPTFATSITTPQITSATGLTMTSAGQALNLTYANFIWHGTNTATNGNNIFRYQPTITGTLPSGGAQSVLFIQPIVSSLTNSGTLYGIQINTSSLTGTVYSLYATGGLFRFDLGSDATGDTYYRDATTGALDRLAIGTSGQVLTVVSGVPAWTTVSAGSTYTAGTGLTLTSGAFSVNTTQNITTLSNLTVAGTVQTSATGVLSSVANTGTGNNVLATSPTLVTPIIGATTYSGVGAFVFTPTLTAASTPTFPAGSGTLAYLAGTNLWSGSNSYTATLTLTTTFSTALSIGNSLTASSGSSETDLIYINPNYNLTGTYNAIVRGIYYNPSITSMTGTNRAFESTSGDVVIASIPTYTTGGYKSLVTNSTSNRIESLPGNQFFTTLATINATATATAAQMQTGWRTTATAAVTVTLPTATLLGTQVGATSTGGIWFDFVVDNSASTTSGTITITLGTGMTAMTAITGGNTLTVAIGIIAIFRVYFTSATVCKIGRIV